MQQASEQAEKRNLKQVYLTASQDWEVDPMEEAERQGIELDMSSHDGKFEGQPYNLDFVVRKNVADE